MLIPGMEVLHWHGDTFDLPVGAVHLAGSQLYANQAFAVDNFALALQFNPEVTENGLERWYVGHSSELHVEGIDIVALREAGKQRLPLLSCISGRFCNQ